MKSLGSFRSPKTTKPREIDEDNQSNGKAEPNPLLDSVSSGHRSAPKRITASNKSGNSNALTNCLSGFTLFLVLVNLFVSCNASQSDAPYAFIQTLNGQVVSGKALDNLDRTNDTLVRFVENWLMLTHNWSGKLPDGKPDSGSRVNGKPAPTALVLGSKALATGFSQAYLTQIQNKYVQKYNPSSYVNDQGYEVVLKILHISVPKKVGTGLWDINVLATRMHYFRGEHVSNESFNQRIRVQAIRPYYNPLGEKASLLVQQHEAMQSSGLSIVQITALTAN